MCLPINTSTSDIPIFWVMSLLPNQAPQPNYLKVSLGMGSERNETAKKTPFPPILIFRGISMLNARLILPSHFSF